MKLARPVGLIDAPPHAVPTRREAKPRFGLPPSMGKALSWLGRVAPSLAAACLDRLWFTPPRPRISKTAQAIVDGHPRFELEVDGRRMAAWTAGEGPTIVLMHGWGGYGAQLSSFIAPLVAAGFRVVVFDGLGHGASDASPLGIRQSSFLDFARGIGAVADKIGPIHGIVAHSGGAVATLLALRARLGVERVALVSPMARPSLFAAQFGKELRLDREVIERWLDRSERRVGFRFSELDLVAAAGEMPLPPTLVVHDREDPEVPFAEGLAVAAAWPDALLHPTSKLGHRLLLRDRGVIDRVTSFFGSSDRSA